MTEEVAACLVCGATPVRGVRRVVEPSCVLFQEVFKDSDLVEADGSFRVLCLVCDNLVSRLEEVSREKKTIKEELGSRLSSKQAFYALRTASNVVETEKDLSGFLKEGGDLSKVEVNVDDEANNAANLEMKEKSEHKKEVISVRAEESLSKPKKGPLKVIRNNLDESDDNALAYPDNKVESQAALPCRLCGNIFSSATKLENHTRNCSDAHIVNCKVCDTYLNKQRISSDILDFKYCLRCPNCDKLFTKKSTLKFHMLHSSHASKRPFVCNIEICGKSFKVKNTLAKHNKLFHEGIKNVESCKNCGAQFRSESGLNEHLCNHKGQEIIKKEWLCTHCEKVFTCRVDLESHMVVHIKMMSHSGEICSTSSSQKVSLKDHEKVNLENLHPVPSSSSEEVLPKVMSARVLFIPKDQSDISEGPSTKTQYLEKAMQQQRDLRYKEVHYNGVLDEAKGDNQLYDFIVKAPDAGPKCHRCTFCGKLGADRSNLRKHVENVHFSGSFCYGCKYCLQTFTSRNKLNHHISGFHKNNQIFL